MSKKLICGICNSEAEVGYVSYTFKRNGREFPYHNIKATVCLNKKCGERFLDGPEVMKIEREIRESVFEKAA